VIVVRGAIGLPRLPLLGGRIGLMLALGSAVVLALRQLPGLRVLLKIGRRNTGRGRDRYESS